jgi:hypothetical protein
MSRKAFLTALLALPLAVAGLVYGKTLTQRQSEQLSSVKADRFICPVTGEELPCPNCCPLNQQK